MPNQWKGNVDTADVQAGDVLFTGVPNSATAQRVAMVDEVIRGADGKASAVIYSEWNYGKHVIDQGCFVTDSFGLPTSGRLPVPAILRVWRPSLPLP